MTTDPLPGDPDPEALAFDDSRRLPAPHPIEGAAAERGASPEASDAIREDLERAHRRAWERLARPGTWWTGPERVAIAAEARAAAYCGFCRNRRAALSPYGLDGEHDRVAGETLTEVAIDTIHRLVTDASRLTASWHAGLAQAGLANGHYVELLSVIVELLSIDGFHLAMGLPPEPLPEPIAGEPSRRTPAGLVEAEAWVPMLPPGRPEAEEADLWDGITGNVIRAMSLVPDAVRGLKELSAAHYLAIDDVGNPFATRGPLSRSQMELIAGRVSALNECFY